MTSIAKRLVAISVLWVLMGAGSLLPNLSLAANDYVGSAVCADCHQTETALWTNSHHDLAMQEASANTILGDFNDVSFTYQGVTSEFSRKDGELSVTSEEGCHAGNGKAIISTLGQSDGVCLFACCGLPQFHRCALSRKNSLYQKGSSLIGHLR